LISFSLSLISFPRNIAVTETIEVDEILKASAAYCEKLEHAILYFVYQEEITEKVNLAKDVRYG
jgi:hypothetical protein